MRFFLIADDQETLHGLRLSGIEGVCVTERQHVLDALQGCMADPAVAIVLITGRLKALCTKEIHALMLERRLPLIVEIPGAGDPPGARDGMMAYIHEAIGLKL